VIQQLYVFTELPEQLSPAACVIDRDKPQFLGVKEILRRSVEQDTRELLKRELEIKLGELEQQWHWDSLERIFIEERIYRRTSRNRRPGKACWRRSARAEAVSQKPAPRGHRRGHHAPDRDPHQAHLGLQPFPGRRGDQEDRRRHQGDQGHLKNLTGYAIAWFERLQEKYGKGHKRRTSTTRSNRSMHPRSCRPTNDSTSTARTASSASTGGSTNL
jgi:topoisomerase-4 subunit A